MDDEELSRVVAFELIREYGAVSADRDRRVRVAWAAGMSKAEIHRVTGLARQTVDTILSDNGKIIERNGE